jgi:hypothetical protein
MGQSSRGRDGGIRKELAAGVGTSGVAMCCRSGALPVISPCDGIKGSRSPAPYPFGRGSRVGPQQRTLVNTPLIPIREEFGYDGY